MKLKEITKSILATLLATMLLFTGLEVCSRIFFPEFKDQIHSYQKTLGKNYYLSNVVPGRVPYPEYLSNLNKPLVLILGDSISHGYGKAYEDIYWVRLQRLMQLELGDNAPEFISLSYYGNQLSDSMTELQSFIKKNQSVKISEIIYQFNFNDIVPEAYSRATLHKKIEPKDQSNVDINNQDTNVKQPSLGNSSESVNKAKESKANNDINIQYSAWFKVFARWRSEFLNYSVFLRTAQHYAGMIIRNKSGTCEERGLDALGPYTWTFGSRKYSDESALLWQNFYDVLKELVAMANTHHIKFSIVISPLLFDIDTSGAHPYYNYLNYDLSCATVNPRIKLASIASKLGVNLYDPTDFIKNSFDMRLKEKNFSPFFFTADENHITPVASSLMADYLYVFRKVK
jgi:hypothetical protein